MTTRERNILMTIGLVLLVGVAYVVGRWAFPELATGLARHPAGLSALAFSKIGCCGVGRSAEIRTRDPQSPRLVR